jgi:hypothetical protein
MEVQAVTTNTIADDVVWLTTCRENIGWAIDRNGRPQVPAGMDACVAGAYLADLEIAGCIECSDKKIVVTQRAFTGDPDLAALLRRITGERPRTASWWVERLAAGAPHLRQIERLRATRALSDYDQPIQGLFGKRNSRRCFAPDWGWGYEASIMERLHAAAVGQPTDARTFALLVILRTGRFHKWFEAKDKDDVERRIDSHWIGKSIYTAICSQIYVPL